MSYVVISKLERKPKEIVQNGELVTVPLTAFLGTDGRKFPSFGIGLIDEEGKARLWGLAAPHCLITAWRGMHILDKVTSIEHGTICACYSAGQRNLHDSDRRYLDDLRKQMGDVDSLRDLLLDTPIDSSELDRMLHTCNDPNNDIGVAMWEIKEELEVGVIDRTTEVEKAIEIDEEERRLRDKNEELSKQPLPPEQSFKKFCEDIDLKYPCDIPFGVYGWDWGHDDLENIDREIVWRGLNFGHAKYLCCTENSKDADSFGELGHPVVHLEDGRNLVLLSVIYKDNDMFVTVKPIPGDNPEEELRISDIREFSPKLVGVACTDDDKDASEEDPDRGYIEFKEKKSVLGRLKEHFSN